jgi:hypothetical protein
MGVLSASTGQLSFQREGVRFRAQRAAHPAARSQRAHCQTQVSSYLPKRADDRAEVLCRACPEVEVVISGWRETTWAEGAMPAVRTTDD